MPANPIHLTILIPGLSSPPKSPALPSFKEIPRFPEFDKLLSRSAKSVVLGMSFDAKLFQLFAMVTDLEKDLPVASVSYLGDTGEVSNNYIFCADPVHLEPNRDELVLFDTDVTTLSNDVYDLIVKELSLSCKGEDWKITMPNKTRWYLEFHAPLEVRTYPLDAVVGTPINDFLPYGRDAQKIRIIFNETQMILHSNSILMALHRKLESAVINSLWFWGGGLLSQASNQKEGPKYWAEIWSDSVLALGLARLNSVKSNKLPNSAGQLLEQAKKAGKHLLILEALQPAANLNNTVDWWNQAELINEQWIAPLIKALNDGILMSLTIIDCEGNHYYATKKDLKRWWKRTKPFYSG